MGPHVRPPLVERIGWTWDSGDAHTAGLHHEHDEVALGRLYHAIAAAAVPARQRGDGVRLGPGSPTVRGALCHDGSIVDHVVVAHDVPAGEPVADQEIAVLASNWMPAKALERGSEPSAMSTLSNTFM